jgi:pimeloyl-ACP methyl ester carboxylesterase
MPLVDFCREEFSICVFDYTGYGYSDGAYSTLGAKEETDLEAVIDTIRHKYSVGQIFVWGRSMGAVSALLLSIRNPLLISGLVIDSPFSSTKNMVASFSLSYIISWKKYPTSYCISCFFH